MEKKRVIFIALLLATVLIVGFYGFIFANLYLFFHSYDEPLYEVGGQKGAAFCGGCHQEIYNQWLENSAHAGANSHERFESFRKKVTGHIVTDFVIGDENCYSCMGPRESLEGVNCEVCHGLVDPELSIMEVHEQKFKPGLEEMKKVEFCVPCHQFPLETGEGMSVYSEWKESEAAKQGLICHDCHMEKRNNISYHGFDSITRSRNVEKYRELVSIKNIEPDFPQFSLEIENHITSHALPPSGPSRLLVLEISFQDTNGEEVYKIVEKFAKRFNLLPFVGIHPFMLQENTQLQSNEVRQLNYTLPPEMEGQIDKAVLTLRFYDVSDEYVGDLSKAHWISEPILEEEVSF